VWNEDSGTAMARQNKSQACDLEGAFATFNQMSEQLVTAYHELEGRVARLNDELNATRSDQLKQLAEKESLAHRLEQILTTLPAGVIVLDGEGIVQESNPAAHNLLGEPLHQQPWSKVLARITTAKPDESGELVLRSGRRVSLTIKTLGKEPGQIILLQDVTDTRELQYSLDRHRRLSAMGEMVASLAHQIRTPLASALLYTSSLVRQNLDDNDRCRFAGKAVARLRYLENIINDMLVFAKGEVSGVESIKVGSLLTELHAHVAQTLIEHGVEFKCKSTNSQIILTGNQHALLSAFENLVMNAIQAGGDNIQIEITVSQQGQDVLFTLTDNGPGISQKIQERIFDPFFTTRADGTGLGLAVVRAVILGHGGEINLTSSPGQGTAFSIRLPSSEGDALPSGFYRPVNKYVVSSENTFMRRATTNTQAGVV